MRRNAASQMGATYIWVYIDANDVIGCLTRFGGNRPGKILNAVAEMFDSDIVSEYEPQYWGYATKAEWDEAEEEISRECEEHYYRELIKYLRGEPCDIRSGTIGMTRAEIARRLAGDDPSLLLPKNKEVLLERSEEIFMREHINVVTLCPQHMALVNRLVADGDEDDSPSA